MLVKGHIFYQVWGVQVFYWAVSVCVLVKVFGGDGASRVLCVCVCVSFRLLWGAQNARWCLLNSKSSPTLDLSSAVWTTCCLEWPASIQTSRILQHPKLPAASVSHRPFQPLFQVQHVVRNSRWMKVTARAREEISSAQRDNAVLLPQRCLLLSKPIEERFEWEKQGGSVFQPCSCSHWP